MFKINLKGAEPVEYAWPEGKPKDQQAKLTIRPFPVSNSEVKMRKNVGKDDKDGGDFNLEFIKEGKENKDIYLYCLLKAEGLTDQEGEKLDIEAKISVPMGDGNVKMSVKEFIYDYCFDSGLPGFVLKKSRMIEEEVEEEKKS